MKNNDISAKNGYCHIHSHINKKPSVTVWKAISQAYLRKKNKQPHKELLICVLITQH